MRLNILVRVQPLSSMWLNQAAYKVISIIGTIKVTSSDDVQPAQALDADPSNLGTDQADEGFLQEQDRELAKIMASKWKVSHLRRNRNLR